MSENDPVVTLLRNVDFFSWIGVCITEQCDYVLVDELDSATFVA